MIFLNKDKAIIINDITKVYNIYCSPIDRLKEFILPGKKLHSEYYALRNVSLCVNKGEIVGIMGCNGAGKSTLLKIITGVLKATNGSVSTTGRISSLLELGAGFNMEYTGLENIQFYGTIMGLSKAEIEEKKESIISFAEIGEYINQPVKSYSSGMFARLAFSCAINVEPDILIVDEILSVGDLRFQAKCFKKFKEFQKKGVTILYVGHDISTLRSFCDRCIWLHKGEIVEIGDPSSISAKYVEFMYRNNMSQVDETSDGDTQLEKCSKFQLEQPLAHWGTKIGLIHNVSMTVDGKESLIYSPKDTVTITFSIPYIDNIDYDTLSVSFSIKNRDGLDLIVQTTYESGIRMHSGKRDGHTFHFSFEPRLANGDYYLALAVENRTGSGIAYYEYLEGAKYFKIYENTLQYSLFLPPVDISIDGSVSR